MRALLVVMTLLAGPASGPVAVQWRGEQAPDDRLRLAVREAVAEAEGRPLAAVEDRALERARLAVSRELPVELRDRRATLRALLDEADLAYREGRFEAAAAAVERARASTVADPALPGAAASLREAELLAARIAWAEGDAAAAERALAAALVLDPDAMLAASRAPPELIRRYEAAQAQLLADREGWRAPILVVDGRTLTDADAGLDIEVEIDGVPGLRPVPAGHHVVAVYRPGHAPVAGWVGRDEPWAVPAAAIRIGSTPDGEEPRICAALGLEQLIVAEQRGPALGLQSYRCGVGWGPRWTGPRERLPAAVATSLAGPFAADAASLAEPWPASFAPGPSPATDSRDLPTRPRARRAWIWGTSAGVTAAVVGGVVAGVLLAGRRAPSSTLEIDSSSFLAGP